MKPIKPELFVPTKEQSQKALNELSKYFSSNKQLTSADHPDLKVRGKRGVCQDCGCTENNACVHPDFGTCWRINDSQNLCSHCVELKNDPKVVKPSSTTK